MSTPTTPGPLVTIVIPVWDQHTKLLGRCLAAIEHEHVQANIVVVDNASTTPIEIRPTAQRVALSPRRSIGAARNAGLEHVTTPYVLVRRRRRRDRTFIPQQRPCVMQRAPDSVGVIGRSIVHENGHTRRGRTPRRAYRLSSRWLPARMPLLWLAGFQASITTTLLRTDCVRAADGFADADIGEDWSLAARVARRGRFICIDEPVRIYHRHQAAGRVTHNDTPSPRLRRAIPADCLIDPHATPAQRVVAAALARAHRRATSHADRS